jgi:hypothetical protein
MDSQTHCLAGPNRCRDQLNQPHLSTAIQQSCWLSQQAPPSALLPVAALIRHDPAHAVGPVHRLVLFQHSPGWPRGLTTSTSRPHHQTRATAATGTRTQVVREASRLGMGRQHSAVCPYKVSLEQLEGGLLQRLERRGRREKGEWGARRGEGGRETMGGEKDLGRERWSQAGGTAASSAKYLRALGLQDLSSLT